jgi:C1A family cysteine protease
VDEGVNVRRYTWKPDIPDVRDHLLTAITTGLPPKVDLRPGCSAVEDQGDLGSCTAQAIVGALEYLERKAGLIANLSRLFLYYQERVIEGTVKEDAGATIRSGVKACAKVGVCQERYWQYRINRFKEEPGKRPYQDAAKRKVKEYLRVNALDDLRGSLAARYPVAFGMSVYESFESDRVAETGQVPMPRPSEKLLGGHAVLAVGYDDSINSLIVRNSWGRKWGLGGYFLLPYAFVVSRGLTDDYWVIHK